MQSPGTSLWVFVGLLQSLAVPLEHSRVSYNHEIHLLRFLFFRHILPLLRIMEANPGYAQVITITIWSIVNYMSFLACSVVPIVAISSRSYGMKLRVASQQTQEALARATEVAEESISQMRTVRSFYREPTQVRLLTDASLDLVV